MIYALLIFIGEVLGCFLGLCIAALLHSNDEPKQHPTCKDCKYRDTGQCPIAHYERIDALYEYGWVSKTMDGFYCKEALSHEPEKL